MIKNYRYRRRFACMLITLTDHLNPMMKSFYLEGISLFQYDSAPHFQDTGAYWVVWWWYKSFANLIHNPNVTCLNLLSWQRTSKQLKDLCFFLFSFFFYFFKYWLGLMLWFTYCITVYRLRKLNGIDICSVSSLIHPVLFKRMYCCQFLLS